MEDKRTRQREEPKPLTAKSRESAKKAAFGKQDEIVKRLLATCDKLDSEIQELQMQLAEARQQPRTDADKEQQVRAYGSQERVLVILDWDGSCDVYCESWVTVKVVELIPGQTADEAVEKLPAVYKQLAWPRNHRGAGYPRFLSPPNDPKTHYEVEEALRRAVKFHDNGQIMLAVKMWNEFRDELALERMKGEL